MRLGCPPPRVLDGEQNLVSVRTWYRIHMPSVPTPYICCTDHCLCLNWSRQSEQTAQPGNASAALQKLQAAAKLINEALPNLPMGTEFHTDVLKIATMVNKALEKAPTANPQSQVANLVQLAKQTAQGAPMAALSRIFPTPNGPAMPGAGGAPGAPPIAAGAAA